jgi:alanine dehydrogenase
LSAERKEILIIGVPKEIKDNEYRIGIIPAGVKELVTLGHKVLVEQGAGIGSGISDQELMAAGADIIEQRAQLFEQAQLILKVKEPLPDEYPLLREGQILFTFLHLAAAPELTQALLARKIIGIAYETIQLEDGSLPLLAPMSEIAGRMSIQIGANCLQKNQGGYGTLLGGVPGVERGLVTIIGGGIAGLNATKMAVGMGARVIVLDINLERLRYLEDIFGSRVTTLMSNSHNIETAATQSDLVIGAVLIPGHKTPTLLTRRMVSQMKQGTVIVDVAVDQGGCTETCHSTTHSQPTYVVDGVIHYCVTNIPGIVARTSTFALANVTLPYVVKIAQSGVEQAIKNDPALAKGVNLYYGKLACPEVAEDLGMECYLLN